MVGPAGDVALLGGCEGGDDGGVIVEVGEGALRDRAAGGGGAGVVLRPEAKSDVFEREVGGRGGEGGAGKGDGASWEWCGDRGGADEGEA